MGCKVRQLVHVADGACDLRLRSRQATYEGVEVTDQAAEVSVVGADGAKQARRVRQQSVDDVLAFHEVVGDRRHLGKDARSRPRFTLEDIDDRPGELIDLRRRKCGEEWLEAIEHRGEIQRWSRLGHRDHGARFQRRTPGRARKDVEVELAQQIGEVDRGSRSRRDVLRRLETEGHSCDVAMHRHPTDLAHFYSGDSDRVPGLQTGDVGEVGVVPDGGMHLYVEE